MFPEDFETFALISNIDMVPLEQDMQAIEDINIKIDALPLSINESIIKNMYGKMEIHDNVMDIYNTDGEIIQTFDLYDYSRRPTTTSPVFLREIKEP